MNNPRSRRTAADGTTRATGWRRFPRMSHDRVEDFHLCTIAAHTSRNQIRTAPSACPNLESFRFAPHRKAAAGYQQPKQYVGVNIMQLNWAPITGSNNYATNGATITPHNGYPANVTATPHKVAGTPGTGKTRQGAGEA